MAIEQRDVNLLKVVRVHLCKAAVAFLTNKVNAAIIANEPSSKVMSNEKGIPKEIKFTAMTGTTKGKIANIPTYVRLTVSKKKQYPC